MIFKIHAANLISFLLIYDDLRLHNDARRHFQNSYNHLFFKKQSQTNSDPKGSKK